MVAVAFVAQANAMKSRTADTSQALQQGVVANAIAYDDLISALEKGT